MSTIVSCSHPNGDIDTGETTHSVCTYDDAERPQELFYSLSPYYPGTQKLLNQVMRWLGLNNVVFRKWPPAILQYNAKSFRMRGHFNKFAMAGRMGYADGEGGNGWNASRTWTICVAVVVGGIESGIRNEARLISGKRQTSMHELLTWQRVMYTYTWARYGAAGV